MNARPLVAGDPSAIVAWRRSGPVTRAGFVAAATALAERLPARGAMLNLAVDRYAFAVGFAAALLRGQSSLLPPNHTAHTVERLRERFVGTYALVEPGGDPHGLPSCVVDGAADVGAATGDIPLVDADLIAAHVFTSGSTGDPLPNAKPWGLLVDNAEAAAQRLAALAAQAGQAPGRSQAWPRPKGHEGALQAPWEQRPQGAWGLAPLHGLSLVATVPPQHMYGFESSVLVALLGGAAFDAGRPFYPADVVAALERLPRPRMLVTTPLHLKACVDSALAMPAADLVLSATAPLAPQLAARAERAFSSPLFEIYGCTEAGQVATRRTLDGPEWRTFDGVRLEGVGDAVVASGGHVPVPVRLADVLEVVDATTFRLLGRSNDLVNIAGKRSSLAHLDFHLNAIAGVRDGAFWLPPGDGGVQRLVAFVVAPGVGARAIRAALQGRVDAAFLPRRIVHVDALPRAETGKLPAQALDAFARSTLAAR